MRCKCCMQHRSSNSSNRRRPWTEPLNWWHNTNGAQTNKCRRIYVRILCAESYGYISVYSKWSRLACNRRQPKSMQRTHKHTVTDMENKPAKQLKLNQFRRSFIHWIRKFNLVRKSQQMDARERERRGATIVNYTTMCNKTWPRVGGTFYSWF